MNGAATENVYDIGNDRSKTVKEIGLCAISGERKQMSQFDVSH